MTIIELRQAARNYSADGVETVALHPLDLDVLQGEFVCVAGASGSGKTTLLNLIGGIDTPSAGTVRVAGRALGGLSRTAAARLRLELIGFVFQSFNLVPVLTAFENVEYVLLLRGLPARERRERTLAALRSVGLEEQARRLPGALSGGQQQRVAVARAIVGAPPIVLADEPTANLDSATGLSLVALLHELNRAQGTTFVFSSHDPRIIGRADRVITLLDGRVAEDRRREAAP